MLRQDWWPHATFIPWCHPLFFFLKEGDPPPCSWFVLMTSLNAVIGEVASWVRAPSLTWLNDTSSECRTCIRWVTLQPDSFSRSFQTRIFNERLFYDSCFQTESRQVSLSKELKMPPYQWKLQRREASVSGASLLKVILTQHISGVEFGGVVE